MIAECQKVCRNDWQDERYGKGRRVMNLMVKKDKESQKARCTVCSGEQYVRVEEEVKK